MLVPLYGFLRGDTIGLVVLVHDTDTLRKVAESLQQAASVRVTPGPAPRVYVGGRALPPECTVAEAGLTALDRIDVVTEPTSTAHEFESPKHEPARAPDLVPEREARPGRSPEGTEEDRP